MPLCLMSALASDENQKQNTKRNNTMKTEANNVNQREQPKEQMASRHPKSSQINLSQMITS